jgi:hypothetical protein
MKGIVRRNNSTRHCGMKLKKYISIDYKLYSTAAVIVVLILGLIALSALLAIVYLQHYSDYEIIGKIMGTIPIFVFLLPIFLFFGILRYHSIQNILRNGKSEKGVIDLLTWEKDRVVCWFKINNRIVTNSLRLSKKNKKSVIESLKEGSSVDIIFLPDRLKKILIYEFYK